MVTNMYELTVKVDAESTAPPDFILYIITEHTNLVLNAAGRKFTYEKQEDIHILKRFGITSKIKILEATKVSNKHYMLKLFIRADLPLISESGVGTYHFIEDKGETLCYGGGSETYKGFSGIIIKYLKGKIEKHYVEMWKDCVGAADKLWNDYDTSTKHLPENIIEMIQNKNSFDNLLGVETKSNFDNPETLAFIKKNDGIIQAGDYAILLNTDLKNAKDILQRYVENGDCKFEETNNLYIFPDFHMEIEKSRDPNIDRLEQRLNCLEDWIKIKLIASQKIIDTDPEMAVVRAGKTAEAIVKDVYIKNFDNDETNVSTMIKKLSEENIIPEHIASWMHTIRSLRNIAVHGDGIDKTQAIDALNASLNVAEWHLDQIKSGKK